MTRRILVISQRESLTLPPVENLYHVTRVNICLKPTSRCRKNLLTLLRQNDFFLLCIFTILWLTAKKRIHLCLSWWPNLPQTPPPVAQDSSVGNTADLLGLNSDPEPSSTSSTPFSADKGDQGGLKAASSNSDLLNDLFAPPAGQTGAVQEDLFFSGPPSAATPDSKRKKRCLIYPNSINLQIIHLFLMHFLLLIFSAAAVGDLFDPFGMGSGSGVGSSVGSSRQASGPDLFGDLLGSDSSATSGFSSAHSNPTPASNTSLFNLSKCFMYEDSSLRYIPTIQRSSWWLSLQISLWKMSLRWHHQPANQTCLVGGTAGQLAAPLALAPPLANPVIPTQVGGGT